MRYTYVRHDGTAGEQCQPITPLRVASGAGGAAMQQHWPRAARGWVGAEGTGAPEGPADMDSSVVAVAVPAVAAGVAAVLTSGGSCGGSGSACVGGGCGGEGGGR